MNTKRLILIALLAILGSMMLGACSGRAPSTNWHGLTADAERAYLSNGAFVYAIDLKDGKQVWKYPAEADSKLMFYAAPVLTSDGQLLVGSAGTNHPFISLDPKNGKEIWAENFTKNKGAWLASPLVFNDLIYAPNADGFLYIIDANGKEASAPVELGGALWSAPVSDGNLLYVSSLDHHAHIINPADMSHKSVALGGTAPSSPAAAENGAYVGSFDASIQFISSDGEKKLVTQSEDWIWGSPALNGDTLYYADLKGNIVSMDAASGKQNWVITQKDDAVVAGLLLNGESIYAATESGKILSIDFDGKIVWEKTPGGKIYTTPAATGDLLLVAPYQADYALVAYDVDGKQVWAFAPEK